MPSSDRSYHHQNSGVLVRYSDVDLVLRNTDDERFEAHEYDAVPMVRALFCRELVGLSWNGLYEYLSTDERAVRLGFDPANFGPYNTAPTRQTLTDKGDLIRRDVSLDVSLMSELLCVLICIAPLNSCLLVLPVPGFDEDNVILVDPDAVLHPAGNPSQPRFAILTTNTDVVPTEMFGHDRE